MNVLISDRAYDDIERIFAWIAKDSLQNARSVNERILLAVDRLAFLPGVGHAGRARGTFEWVVVGLPYIIVYTADRNRDELQVHAVLHGAMERD